MRSFIPFILLLIFPSLSTHAQESLKPFNLSNPDFSSLEFLTFQTVNELRKEKALSGLVWDAVLKRAAKDHAEYLIKEKKLSHHQPTKGKRTPAARVKIHGGLIYTIIGENIVEVPLGVYVSVNGIKKSTITYQSSAQTMAQIWKASPRHYKNIIAPEYNCSALAVAYDSVKQRLIAVQVFGYSATPSAQLNLPDNASQLQKLPEQQLPFRLKEYKYNPKNKKAINRFQQLKLERGYLTGSFKTAKKIFKGRRSGISLEYIPLSQFDSASKDFASVPNRRNGLFELNGKLVKPVYRRKLLKYSRKHTPRDYIINTPIFRIKAPTTQFVYPLGPNGRGWEYNFFLIKSKRLATYRSYLNVPGKLFEDKFPQLHFVNSFKEAITEEKFRIYHTYDTLRYKIFYSPGIVTIPPEKQEEIWKSMASKTGKIINVEASAYASIEGDKKSNVKLVRQRMEQFIQLINPYKDSIIAHPKIKTREQWQLFHQQIMGTRLESLKKMGLGEVRKYVNQHKEDPLLSTLLDEQRYMEFTMIWRNDHQERLPTKTATEIYDSLKTKAERSTKPNRNLVRELEKAQLALYYELSQKDKEVILVPKIPDLELYPAFQYHELIFRYSILQDISDKEFYDKLHKLARSKYFPGSLKSEAIYNNLVFIYQKYLSGELENYMDYGKIACYQYRYSKFYFKKFKKIKCKECKGCLIIATPDYYILKEIPRLIARGKRMQLSHFPENELWQYYYLYTIHSLYPFVPINGQIYRLLHGIKKYYHPVDTVLTEKERLKLAYLYSCFDKYKTAKDLLKPIATRNVPNLEALKLYVTLLYEDYKDDHAYIEMLINEFSRLGKKEWCDLWFNPDYLNFLLLEDLKLKNFYNCNCGR